MQNPPRFKSIRRAALARILSAAALVTLCGCTEELEFEHKFSTDHFDYSMETRLEREPCDAAQQWLERYYEGISGFLGVSLPAGQKIQYHVVEDPSDPRLECKPNLSCAIGTNIYSWRYIGGKEIVRATASLLGNPPIFFQEGLAEILACDNFPWYADGPIENIFFTDLVRSRQYEFQAEHGREGLQASAGSFVRRLIDVHGKEKFFSFYAHAPYNGTNEEIETVFEQEYGTKLIDEFWNWALSPAPVHGDLCLRVMECGSNIPELTNGNVDLGCAPDGYESGYKEGIFRFQIDNDRPKQVVTTPQVTDPQEISMVNLLRCSGGAALPTFTYTADFHVEGKPPVLSIDPVRTAKRLVFDAPAGDYVAWFRGKDNAATLAEMVEAASPMRDGSCALAAEPLLMNENEIIVLSSRWMDRSCTGFYCPGIGWDVKIGPSGGIIETYPWTTEGRVMFSPTKIYLCTDPCPTSIDQCEQLTFEPDASPKLVQSKQVFAPGTVVHVAAPLAPLHEHFSLHMRIVQP